jgi:hypothetical protein
MSLSARWADRPCASQWNQEQGSGPHYTWSGNKEPKDPRLDSSKTNVARLSVTMGKMKCMDGKYSKK